MAKIDARCDLALDLTLFDVSGRVTAEDFVRAVKTSYGSNPTSNAIWDLTRCDLSNINMSALIKMSDIANEFAAKRKNPRTIFVVEQEQETFLIMLYGVVLEMRDTPIDYSLVSSLDEAYEKLTVGGSFESSTTSRGD